MTRVKQMYLIHDTEERSRHPRYYFSSVKPPEDSPQKLIAVIEMNILRLHLDYEALAIWKILHDMA